MLGQNDVLRPVSIWGVDMPVTRIRNPALPMYGVLTSRSSCLRHCAHLIPGIRPACLSQSLVFHAATSICI